MQTMNSKQTVAVAIISAALLGSPELHAAPTLVQELSAIEWVPTKAALLRHGADVDARLRALASSGPALARHRALSVLRYFPSAKNAAFLRGVVERFRGVRSGLPVLYLQQALGSYAAVVGPEALPYVEPFLRHASLDMRCHAAAAVRLSRSPRARAALRARFEVEASPTVKAELLQQLRQLLQDEQRAAGRAN